MYRGNLRFKERDRSKSRKSHEGKELFDLNTEVIVYRDILREVRRHIEIDREIDRFTFTKYLREDISYYQESKRMFIKIQKWIKGLTGRGSRQYVREQLLACDFREQIDSCYNPPECEDDIGEWCGQHDWGCNHTH